MPLVRKHRVGTRTCIDAYPYTFTSEGKAQSALDFPRFGARRIGKPFFCNVCLRWHIQDMYYSDTTQLKEARALLKALNA